jgi:hypothetical protein
MHGRPQRPCIGAVVFPPVPRRRLVLLCVVVFTAPGIALCSGRLDRSANLPPADAAPSPPGERLEVDADGEPLGGPAPLTVKFAATFGEDERPGPRHFTYTWNFDDGTTAAGPKPVHTFRRHGLYLVRLDVTDGKRQGQAFAQVRAWTPEEWKATDPAIRQKAIIKNIRLLERRTGQTLPPDVRKRWGLPAKPSRETP